MPRILCVHGIGQQRKGPRTLHGEWFPAMEDGCRLADTALDPSDVECVFYGGLFRPAGRPLSAGDPVVRPEDLDEFEIALLQAWWQEAGRVDGAVVSPDARTLAAAPRSVQRGLRALSGSRFFAGLAERTLLFDLRQVRRYFREPEIRQAARQALADALSGDVRVVVGHSLGSVVAYETLCAQTDNSVEMLVTLGSPLGIQNLIFDRLQPAPRWDRHDGPLGVWPSCVRRWVNVVDEGDVVALAKDLRPYFGPHIEGFLIDNGATAHNVQSYLTAQETGGAISQGMGPNRRLR